MPSHSTAHAGSPGGGGESIGTKMKNLLTGRRQSKISPEDKADADTAAAAGAGNSAPKDERILDQSGGGAQLPSAAANAVGANNTNANAETGWPGIVGGEKLAAVMVSLSSIDQHGVKLHETKKEGSYVTVPVGAYSVRLESWSRTETHLGPDHCPPRGSGTGERACPEIRLHQIRI